jgi:hypothetical protein
LFHLVIFTDAAAFQFVRPLPIFQAHVVKIATDRKRIEHTLDLCRRGIETELERFDTHTQILL